MGRHRWIGEGMALALYWTLYVAALILPMRWSVYLFFAGLSLGTFNALPVGINLTPYAMAAPLMAAKILARARHTGGGNLADCMLNPLRFGLLTAFVLYALLVTAAAPGLFAGADTIGLNTSLQTGLRYGAGNLTQGIYLATAWLMAISLYVLTQDQAGRAILAQGVMVGGAMAVLAGIADMATAGSAVLAPLRTAQYALLTDAAMGGLRRVVGLSPEASSYGALTLFFATALLFMRPARQAGALCRLLELPLAGTLLLFCLLSTSSSALLGLAAALLLWWGRLVVRAATLSHRRDGHGAAVQLVVLVAILATAILVLAQKPGLLTPVWTMMREAVFHKVGTSSYMERATWSRVSLAGMMQTGGFGVGLGSTRASSWPVALLASTGLLGTALMTGFLIRCLTAALPAASASLRTPAQQAWRDGVVGARLAWLACFVPAAGTATSVDFGFHALFFAVMISASDLVAPMRGPITGAYRVSRHGAVRGRRALQPV